MRKIIILMIVALLLLEGCKGNIDPMESDNQVDEPFTSSDSNNLESVKETSIESIQTKILSMSDSELLSNYVNPLEISVPNLDFESTQELTSEELYRLFRCFLFSDIEYNSKISEDKMTLYEARYDALYEQWFESDKQVFVINENDITALLDQYMKVYNFDITQCQEYNSDTGNIETMMIDGIAGERHSEVVNREMDGNQLIVTVQFYTESDEKEKDEMKDYIFEFYEDGYYILQDKTRL